MTSSPTRVLHRLPPSAGGRAVACCLVAVLATGAGAGCSSPGSRAAPSQTVTVTSTPDTSRPSAEPTSTSDVTGRAHDAGTVRTVGRVGGTLVVELDRLTVKGLPDERLAKDGTSVTPHTQERFANQNERKTYTVPVAPGAVLVVNDCVKSGEKLGMRSSPQDAAAWLRDPDQQAALLLTLDLQGRATRLDTDPRC